MSIICLDVESYYSQEFSLSKMTTEAYINDKQFEVIGFAYSVDGAEPRWVTGNDDYIADRLHELELHKHSLLCHNTAFDGAILSWRYGIVPKQYFDTLSMARPLHAHTVVGGSLAKLAKEYGLPDKGKEVLDAKGKHRNMFTAYDLAQYGRYCQNDVNITWQLFHKLLPHIPKKEMYLIDLFIRMYTQPTLELDAELLQSHLENVRETKQKLLERIKGADPSIFMSNPKFAKLLRHLGVEPPMKTSAATGQETYAFSKTDPAFKALQDHDDPRVQTVVAARLGLKSTLEETRTESLIGVASRGKLPILLNYYGAATGRASGGDKMNLQNLPSRGGKNTIRRAIMAPEGHQLVVVDSSQIEARIVAWLAGQDDLVKAFADRQDVYKRMAATLYSKSVDDISASERFIGKTVVLGCIGEGTPVLCDSGWKPIEQVSLDDKLWDGEEWVCHQGLVNKGIKKTLNLCGVWLTPDHKVWSGMQWLEAQSVAVDESILYQTLVAGAENLPSQVMCGANEWASKRSLLSATATKMSTLLTGITSKTSKALGATYALNNNPVRPIKNTGAMWTLYPMTCYGKDFLLVYPRFLFDATTRAVAAILTTVDAVSRYIRRGVKIVASSYGTSLHSTVTTDLNWNSIGSTTIRVTNQTISASQLGGKTTPTNVNSKRETLKPSNSRSKSSSKKLPTYDIAYAGPRNRFTILTDSGPLIVHNCGYGMSANKFKDYIGLQGVKLDDEEAQRIIKTYRKANDKIAKLWYGVDAALKEMADNKPVTVGKMKLPGDFTGFYLPNGMIIRYPGLRWDATEQSCVYDSKYGAKKIYGAAAVENIVQALARIVVFDQMMKMNAEITNMNRPGRLFRTVMSVHDETVLVVPEDSAEWALKRLMEHMFTPPKWAPDLPVACEGSLSKRYGDAK